MIKDPAADVVQREARGFEPTADGMGPLLEAIGDARLVLIGEATHGTHEFDRTRAELTKALIARTGFKSRGSGGRLARCVSRQPMGASRDI